MKADPSLLYPIFRAAWALRGEGADGVFVYAVFTTVLFCMKLWNPSRTLLAWLLIGALCYSGTVLADPSNTSLSDLLGTFKSHSKALSDQLQLHASSLFWILALISLTWTMSMHLLRRSDIGEVLAELVRFVVFTGLFFWFLQNASETSTGDGFVGNIVQSFSTMAVDAATAGGAPTTNLGRMGATADSLISTGLEIFDQIVDNMPNAGNSDLDNASMLILGFVVLVALAMTGIYVVIVTMSFWALAYAGIFLLGFGGSRWTSSVAINYYKHVFGVAVAYMATILLLAFGMPFLQDYNTGLDPADKIKGLAVMVVISLLLLMLVAKIPKLLYNVVATSRLGEAFEATGIFTQTLATARSAVWSSATQAYGDARSLLTANREASDSAAGRSAPHELFKPSSYETASTYSTEGFHGETRQPSSTMQGSAFGTAAVSRGESVARASAATSAGSVMTGAIQNARADVRPMPAIGEYEMGRASAPAGSMGWGGQQAQSSAGQTLPGSEQAQAVSSGASGASRVEGMSGGIGMQSPGAAAEQTSSSRVASAGASQATTLPPDFSALQSGAGQIAAGGQAQMSTLSPASAASQAGAQTLQSRVGSVGASQVSALPPDLGALQSGAGQLAAGGQAQMSAMSMANAGLQAGAQTVQSRVGGGGASQVGALPSDLGALQSSAGQVAAGAQPQMSTLSSASAGSQASATGSTQIPQPRVGGAGASHAGEFSPDLGALQSSASPVPAVGQAPMAALSSGSTGSQMSVATGTPLPPSKVEDVGVSQGELPPDAGVRSGQLPSASHMQMPAPSPQGVRSASAGVAGVTDEAQAGGPAIHHGGSAASGMTSAPVGVVSGSSDSVAGERLAKDGAQAAGVSTTGSDTSLSARSATQAAGQSAPAIEGGKTSANQALPSQSVSAGAGSAKGQDNADGGHVSSAPVVAGSDKASSATSAPHAGTKATAGTEPQAAPANRANGEPAARAAPTDVPSGRRAPSELLAKEEAEPGGRDRRAGPASADKRDGKNDKRPPAKTDRGDRTDRSKQKPKNKLDKDRGPLRKKTGDTVDKNSEAATFRDRRPASQDTQADPDGNPSE